MSEAKVASELVELTGNTQATAAKTKRKPKRPAKRAATKKTPRASSEDGAATKAEDGGAKKKRVCNFKKHAKSEISGAFPDIVHTLIEEAKGGSLNHTKLLFDLGGVKEQVKEEMKHKNIPPSFVKVLMHALVEQTQGELTHEPQAATPGNQPETDVAKPEATLSSR